jgi:ubiquinone/menaquinone biosynthesis C-methylase UbiE
MLDIARDRIEQHGWTNVELVESDIVAYDFPESVNGVLATGLFGYIPEYDQVIKAASKSLVSGGHISILDGKQPENLPAWQFKIVLKLGGPFGYTPEYFNVRPWEPVENYFKDVSFETRYGGMIYLLSGTVK